MREPLNVRAVWDKDAAVWIATSDDIPGLITEADTIDQMLAKLKTMIPELLEANGVLDDLDEIPFNLLSECSATAHSNAA
jgi:predicted RNase H-like HicB family nuclease